MKPRHLSLAIGLLVSAHASAEDFVDDFSRPNLEGRLAERGDWKFENHQARAVADPELYRQFKNHGPILKWPREFNDARIRFEMKAVDCQRVVFTLNGDGHVFRVALADETVDSKAGPSRVPTRIIAWATTSSKENLGDTIEVEGLPDVPAINGRWVPVTLSIKGDRGELSIGDFKTTIQHPALARDKNLVMLTFAHGELAVRDFRMTSSRTPSAGEPETQTGPGAPAKAPGKKKKDGRAPAREDTR